MWCFCVHACVCWCVNVCVQFASHVARLWLRTSAAVAIGYLIVVVILVVYHRGPVNATLSMQFALAWKSYSHMSYLSLSLYLLLPMCCLICWWLDSIAAFDAFGNIFIGNQMRLQLQSCTALFSTPCHPFPHSPLSLQCSLEFEWPYFCASTFFWTKRAPTLPTVFS